MPTYNGEKYLSQSLNAITNQTYKNLEIIVSDDGSTDSTLDIVREYQHFDDRIRLTINDRPSGMVHNWNRCLLEAKGTWVKLHFQDDLMNPEAIEIMLAHAHHANCKLILSDREFIFEDKIRKPYLEGLPSLSDCVQEPTELFDSSTIINMLKQHQLKYNFIGEPIIGLIHRSLIAHYGGFDARYLQIVDFEFWLRLVLNVPFVYTREKLFGFRVHDRSQTSVNSSKKALHPSHHDRILLALDFAEGQWYENTRKIMTRTELLSLVDNTLKRSTGKLGFLKSYYKVDKRVLNYKWKAVWRKMRPQYV